MPGGSPRRRSNRRRSSSSSSDSRRPSNNRRDRSRSRSKGPRKSSAERARRQSPSPKRGRRSPPRRRSPSPRRHRSRTPPRKTPPPQQSLGLRHVPPKGRSPAHRSPPRHRDSSPAKRKSPRRSSPGSSGRRSSPKRKAPSPSRKAGSPPRRRSSAGRSRRSQSRSPRRPDNRPVINEAESTTPRDPPRRESNIAQNVSLLPVSKSDHANDTDRRRSSPVRRQRSRSPVRRRSPDEYPYKKDSDMRNKGDQDHRKSNVDRYGDKDDRKHDTAPSKATTLLSELFSSYGFDSTKSFYPEDNITVGIERSIRGNSPVRRRTLHEKDWQQVHVIRPNEEDQKPLYSREEFKPRPEDYSERRVIRVEGSSSKHGRGKKENFEVRRDRKSLSERWQDSDDTLHVKDTADNVKIIRKLDGHKSAPRMDKDDRDSRRHGDRDERITSKRSYRDEDLRDPHREKFVRDPGDLRHNLTKRKQSGSESESRREGRSIRDRLGEKKLDEDLRRGREDKDDRDKKNALPDFSKRPDRFANDDWKDNPEMIPKGISYYEHDNREDFRGRGRGFRGRGRGRGVWRGRGGYAGGTNFSTGYRPYVKKDTEMWAHDMFEDENADKEPSSTT